MNDDEFNEAMERLNGLIRWADAYPEDIFVPPDTDKAHELLQAGGMTIDAISAHVLRWAAKRAADDARFVRDFLLKTRPA